MKLLVLGAGAWGTALAANAARQHQVTLWARDTAHADVLRSQRRNGKYLPGIDLPADLQVGSGDPAPLARGCDLVIVATPMAGLRGMLQALATCPAPVAW